MNAIQDRAILVRLSISCPGENRQDLKLSNEVKREHSLGTESGKWVKHLYPPTALREVKALAGACRTYHNSVTLPWDQGVGILPAPLYYEYMEKVRDFRAKIEMLRDKFLDDPQKWVDWAVAQHNGSFDPGNYPGCTQDSSVPSGYRIDKAAFAEAMAPAFAMEVDPMPVPTSNHFTQTISSLLGTDVASVDQRVAEGALNACRELLQRLLRPVAAMAAKLGEEPKRKDDGTMREDIVFRDSLVGNLIEIARIAPSLNLNDDPMIKQFIAEIEALTVLKPNELREDKSLREAARSRADELAKRMAAYKI